jgi:hypothetical protein
MTKAKTKIPTFKTEAEERAFWEKHDSTDYVDWSSLLALPRFFDCIENIRCCCHCFNTRYIEWRFGFATLGFQDKDTAVSAPDLDLFLLCH